ncbi:MAG: 30S ribosomal protein S4 [Deltaproteobacteria bacterium]|nr:MAG: 30S ribosomal protein S4 [Deltaproteobacteria bacterium]
MARFKGPRVKKMRALGTDLPGLSRKSIDRRPYPPGQHGKVGRRKITEYGRRLIEKQKLRFNYGLSERQLRRLFDEARRSKKATGEKLLELLESRLDNAVFRAGFAPTIPAARQLVSHGHITVNGKRVNIASFRISVNDEIGLREKSKKLACVEESLDAPALLRPNWVDFDDKERTAKVLDLPGLDSVPFDIDVQLVIEYYSR